MNNSSPDFQIRPIAQGDREQWAILFLAYGVFYETDFSPEVLDGVWKWLMNPSHPIKAWVASGDHGLLGFAHLRFHDDTFTAGPAWFLDDLFTSPQARGKGVATGVNHRSPRPCRSPRWRDSALDYRSRKHHCTKSL